ncbi:galactose oxidase [Gigaspora margarita]|uniref:Galactose oxidase n=1 Tax=Gigaspora margarita TaxID=4874 RepID=A0A8H3X1V4_GIGMA|nr:galactose oxidase [Gigaspora margarita]
MLYFSFYILVFLLNFTSAFIPVGRESHSSVLIDRKLYFIGGFRVYDSDGNRIENTTNEFFYLDVSKQFTLNDSSTIPWNDLTNTGGPKLALTAVCSGEFNDMIYVFGGKNNEIVLEGITVYQYNLIKKQWINNIKAKRIDPSNRSYNSCAKFNGSMIIMSGQYIHNDDVLNDAWLFNTVKSSWRLSQNRENVNLIRFGYQAISFIDAGTIILYIGGSNTTDPYTYVPMDQLLLYNTNTDEWTTVKTSGTTPPGRIDFSAVLTTDRRVIIFGGSDNTTHFGDLWILNIETFQWSIGNITNPISDLQVSSHTATLIDNYMLVAFGQFSNFSTGYLSSKIFLLDVSQNDSYKWVNEFIPNSIN